MELGNERVRDHVRGSVPRVIINRPRTQNYQQSRYHTRTLVTRVGKLERRVAQDPDGRFSTELFERYPRSEQSGVGGGAGRDVSPGCVDPQGHRGAVRPRLRLRHQKASGRLDPPSGCSRGFGQPISVQPARFCRNDRRSSPGEPNTSSWSAQRHNKIRLLRVTHVRWELLAASRSGRFGIILFHRSGREDIRTAHAICNEIGCMTRARPTIICEADNGRSGLLAKPDNRLPAGALGKPDFAQIPMRIGLNRHPSPRRYEPECSAESRRMKLTGDASFVLPPLSFRRARDRSWRRSPRAIPRAPPERVANARRAPWTQ
jgi:Transposase, Mutator family